MAYGTDTVRRAGTSVPLETPRARQSFDVATVFGISAAAILIATAIFLGGSPGAFIDLPAIFIVLGGTFGVTTACFSIQDMVAASGVVSQAFHRSSHDPSSAARHVIQLADISRRRGMLSLQDYLPDLAKSGLLFRGISMVVDGNAADDVERILQRAMQSATQRNMRTVAILRKAAEISPAMGLIGTLVGLVQMLGNLENPSAIGPSMAVALLTTFYGAVLANVVFTPLASKLERNAMEEMLINQLYLMAATSIARQENPRRLEMLVNTVLPPGHRVAYFR
ncbi:MAG: MotA/TolQ/ExbB proton channel family protein [Alphaproteobacteria bacterium]|nr:MotA/TolQ/ExbB proton channel family protein [Alphaproteobacteria bacterium]